MNGKLFKELKHIGKLVDLLTALDKIQQGLIEEQLAAKGLLWIYLSIKVYKSPLSLHPTNQN